MRVGVSFYKYEEQLKRLHGYSRNVLVVQRVQSEAPNAPPTDVPKTIRVPERLWQQLRDAEEWLSHAEKVAKLPKLDGSLWHAYRRKWATERKQSNPKDVAAAGGWKDVSTLLEVYQQSDEQSVLAVTSVTLKLRDRGVA